MTAMAPRGGGRSAGAEGPTRRPCSSGKAPKEFFMPPTLKFQKLKQFKMYQRDWILCFKTVGWFVHIHPLTSESSCTYLKLPEAFAMKEKGHP